jgi:hypothetical protein
MVERASCASNTPQKAKPITAAMRKTGRRSWPHLEGILTSPFGQVYTRSALPISYASSAARPGGNLNVATLVSRITIVERLVDEKPSIRRCCDTLEEWI